ncbi:protein NipSnap-like [Watersipora subatra]|uniref:protein NipSnap-like n=1 Tax=Watersipora subatra TaxID=2589382 RepID=UPI00355C3CDA
MIIFEMSLNAIKCIGRVNRNLMQYAKVVSQTRCFSGTPALTTDSWFKKIIPSRQPMDTPSETQSKLLSELDSVYELQFHKVKPENMLTYLTQFGKFVDLMDEKNTGAQLMASFTVMIGDQDEAIHLWKYKGGYAAYNKALMAYRTDPDILEYRLERNSMLRSRYNQILLRFGFWEFKRDREPNNMYELRSYDLKAGSMIEWGNHWARGLKHRQGNNEAVCGFFSHIGNLNQCHHLWAYKDLQTRKETRDAAWQRPGWDENVRYTVPLIRNHQSRILIPTPSSPLQ